MANLYPSLHARFKSEDVCPICLTEMNHGPKYTCSNSHPMCCRCKPHYYSCPICGSPLDVETAPPEVQPYQVPPPYFQAMAQPLPPTAPTLDAFFDNERRPWGPPQPTPDQELHPCRYGHLGCWTRVPQQLRELHESRCQFRSHRDDQLVQCSYRTAGCNVRLPDWRRIDHERICIYRDKSEDSDVLGEELPAGDDPDELVECKFRVYGCLVRMPRRRRATHELKCNYRKYRATVEEHEEDPEMQVDCKWMERGCRVRPKLRKRQTHEEKCNYRLESCSFKDNGCKDVFQPSRRYLHERSCPFAE